MFYETCRLMGTSVEVHMRAPLDSEHLKKLAPELMLLTTCKVELMVLPISLNIFQNQSYGNHMSEFEVDFI